MTRNSQDIREIDLMAYADGLLDGDTVRKAAVEAYLEANPGELGRVAAIKEDNRLISELYEAELQRPVPQWMSRLVHEPAPRRMGMPAMIAASLMVAALAAGSGWFIGQSGGASVPPELLSNIADHHSRTGPNVALAQTSSSFLLPNQTPNVLINVSVPDLGAHGFKFSGRSMVDVDGQRMVRVVYNSTEETINLFLRLRRNAKISEMQEFKTDGISVYYWSEGALAYAVTFDAENDRSALLAQLVRAETEPGQFVEPTPSDVAGQVNPVTEDDFQAVDGQANPLPGLSPSTHFN